MKQGTHTRSRRGALELRLGWLLAGLVLLVWPLALLHEATTVHAVCPEHGERLDVGAAEPAGHDAGEEGEHAAPGEEPGSHEECPLVLLAQITGEGSDAAECCVRLEEVSGALPGGSTACRASIPLILLAPKQSPPV